MALAVFFSVAEVLIPMFYDAFPRNVFAVLVGISTAGAIVARVIMQRNLHES